MSLVSRLSGVDLGEDEEKLAVHQFYYCLVELSEGFLTKAEIVSYFSLDAQEESNLDWLISRYNAQPNASAKEKFLLLIHGLFILAEGQVPGYSTTQDLVNRINAI